LLLAVTNIFDLDMNQKQTDSYYSFLVNQADYQSRTIQANLYITYIIGAERNVYNLTNETVTISYEYTDSSGDLIETYEFACTKVTSVGNNVITFVIPNIAIENAGSVKAQLRIYKNVSTVLNSALFLFYVNASLSTGLTTDTAIPILYVAPIIGSTAPTTSTVGLLGQQYIDDVGDNLYYCSNIVGSVYTWTIVSGESAYEIDYVVFFDDFDGDSLDTRKWLTRITGTNFETYNNELQTYKAANVIVANSILKLHGHRVTPGNNVTWDSGCVDTASLFEWGAGVRVSVRAKFPYLCRGSWPAAWSYNAKWVNHPSGTTGLYGGGGEIDIVEMVNGDAVCYSTIHYYDISGVSNSVTEDVAILPNEWHTYWSENDGITIKIGVDDQTILNFDISDATISGFNPFIGEQCSQFLRLNLAIGGTWPDPPDGTTLDDFYAEFDWVKIETLDPKRTVYTPKYMSIETLDPMVVGDTQYIVQTIDETAIDRTTYYHSTNEAVATVDDHGRILAVGAGECKIYIFTNGCLGLVSDLEVTVS